MVARRDDVEEEFGAVNENETRVRRLGPVSDVFQLGDRGCIVAIPNGEISPDVRVRTGDGVVIHSDGQPPVRTQVRGVDWGNGRGGDFVAILLGPNVKKDDIGPGSTLMLERSGN